jgi:polar amino acid transport system substrate-binding protein
MIPDVLRDLAPTGVLRAGINFGNPVLAQRDPVTGQPRGASVDLAGELGRQLDVGVELVTFDAAGKLFDALKSGAWDVAFMANDPVRSAEVIFTAPYLIIEARTWYGRNRLSPPSKTSIARTCALRL